LGGVARFAAEAGADAVVASTPYYIPLEQREIVSYVSTLAAQQPLPLFLYNIPQLSKTAYEVETVRQLAELPKVIGIKDSSGDPSYLAALHATIRRSDWAFFVGTEALLADAIIAGTHGCVPGGANLDPALFVALYDAAVRRDTARVAALRQRVVMLDRIYRLSPGAGSIVRGLKCALECLGVCGRRMAEPMRSCDDAECRTIAGYVADLGLTRVASTPVSRPRLQVRKTVRSTAPGATVVSAAKSMPRPAAGRAVRSTR
jgi:4-hydroxy-tetrahydrodipicolinate synthase